MSKRRNKQQRISAICIKRPLHNLKELKESMIKIIPKIYSKNIIRITFKLNLSKITIKI